MNKNFKVRAVFSDVDGTLLNSSHRVTPRTGEWIHRLADMEIPFVIVSARSPSGIYPIMRRNDFECALIAYSGALIMDRDRKILFSREIERGLALKIEQFFEEKKYDMSWCIYSGDDWLSRDRSDPRIAGEESIVEAQSREGSVGDLADGAGIEREVKEAFPEVAVVKSSDILLEIMALGISKADAVNRFCEHLGVDPQEAVAFGDNFNDVEMLDAVGRSYVMGNAPQEILEGHPYHTADNDHDGIADALDKLFGERTE